LVDEEPGPIKGFVQPAGWESQHARVNWVFFPKGEIADFFASGTLVAAGTKD
jgi:hypothetical protein